MIELISLNEAFINNFRVAVSYTVVPWKAKANQVEQQSKSIFSFSQAPYFLGKVLSDSLYSLFLFSCGIPAVFNLVYLNMMQQMLKSSMFIIKKQAIQDFCFPVTVSIFNHLQFKDPKHIQNINSTKEGLNVSCHRKYKYFRSHCCSERGSFPFHK